MFQSTEICLCTGVFLLSFLSLQYKTCIFLLLFVVLKVTTHAMLTIFLYIKGRLAKGKKQQKKAIIATH